MLSEPTFPIRSLYSGIVFPVLPTPEANAMLAVQFQLQESERLPAEEIQVRQLGQLDLLCRHAFETIPFYRTRFESAGYRPGQPLTADTFAALPLLRRAELQQAGTALLSNRIPPKHGKLVEHMTSGSSGQPVRAVWTELTRFFWKAFTLREHFWHQRDLSCKLGAIRSRVKSGTVQGWGPSTDEVFHTGPCALLDISTDIDAQARWLAEENPDYLISHPSNLKALARRCTELGIRPSKLREARSFGEVLEPETRTACREAWGVKVADLYSSEEFGCMAIQCPKHEHYHVQLENVYFEVLRNDGSPCKPGEIGRVVVTTLHNFAMPLIRYEILDFAEVGSPCDCGRNLPVLNRLLGRKRNLVTYPDGRKHWPSFPAVTWFRIYPIRQFQIVQKTLDRLVMRFVVERRLSADEEKQFVTTLQELLGFPFHIDFEYVDDIPRKNFKYEDFVSEL